MSEQTLMSQIMLFLGRRLDVKLFRNNTGTGWVGKRGKTDIPGAVLLLDARPLHAGLCKGSSDLIGFTSVKITPDMVGKTVAIFTAIEIKDGAKVSDEQKNFIEVVGNAGGYIGVARNTEDAARIVNGNLF